MILRIKYNARAVLWDWKNSKNLREFIIMNEAETAHKNQKEI